MADSKTGNILCNSFIDLGTIGAITYGIPHGTQFLMIIRMMLSVAIIIKYARTRVFRLDCATLVGYFLCVCISTLICQRGNSLNLLKSVEYVTFIWAAVKFFYCMKQQEWIKFLRAAKNIGYFYIIGSLLSNILYLMTHTVRNYQGTWFFWEAEQKQSKRKYLC